jgi:predicted anti-sigma-YlaC factor YlaD
MLDRDELNKLTRAVLETSEHELGCDECLEEVDDFVELKLAGLDAAAAMPLIHNHLQKCSDCREEFEALLTAVRSMEGRNGGSVFDSVRRLWRGRREGP